MALVHKFKTIGDVPQNIKKKYPIDILKWRVERAGVNSSTTQRILNY
jgi:hypothetical protein